MIGERPDPEQQWADALLRETASIFPGLPSLARAAIRERDAAEAVIRKVARIHVPVREGQNEGVCSQCRAAEPWPCETARALPIWARPVVQGVPDVDYGPVWVDVIDTPTKPPYGTPERAAYDARCHGCSEPNRCGSECPDA